MHDISDGGRLVALAEMCLAGNCGSTILWEAEAPEWFSETQGAYLVALSEGVEWPDIEEMASPLGIDTKLIAITEGDEIDGGVFKVSLADLQAAHEGFFPELMGADAALA